MAKDRNGDVCVLFDRLQDLDVLQIGLVSFFGSVLQCEPVLLCLAVAGEKQHRTCVSSLDAEEQVQEDEWKGVPVMDESDHVQGEPAQNRERLDDEKRPRADAGGGLVGNPFSKRGLVVMDDIDGMGMVFQ